MKLKFLRFRINGLCVNNLCGIFVFISATGGGGFSPMIACMTPPLVLTYLKFFFSISCTQVRKANLHNIQSLILLCCGFANIIAFNIYVNLVKNFAMCE